MVVMVFDGENILLSLGYRTDRVQPNNQINKAFSSPGQNFDTTVLTNRNLRHLREIAHSVQGYQPSCSPVNAGGHRDNFEA